MKKYRYGLFVLIIIFAIALAACGGDEETPEATPEETAEEPMEQPTGRGALFNTVKERGKVLCGSRTDLAGFGYLDADGKNVGFDIDFCRAVAAAVFNDPEAVEFVFLTAAERGPALQTGE
ncbi:MAG: transporter substrate-binding domain-containing protein, partial [Candidatus Promineifilaceae bacterium]